LAPLLALQEQSQLLVASLSRYQAVVAQRDSAALAATLSAGISGGYLRPALLVVGVLLGSVTWWCVLAALAAGLRARITPRVVRGISTASGIAIIALGLAALVSSLGT